MGIKTISNSVIRLFAAILFFLLNSYAAFAVTADFDIDPGFSASGCAAHTVQFRNKSTGATTYLWRLGNGNNSVLKDPGAIYFNPGKYTVTLIAKDAAGNVDSIVKTDYITVFAKPTANFSGVNTKGCAPLSVSFTDKTALGSGNIKSYLWDFGDGKTSTVANPTHTYTLTGSYTVTLIVTDVNGCSSTKTFTNFVVIPTKPSVKFKTSDSVGCGPPLKVTFTPTASSSIGGGLKYSWDFGDGNTSNKEKPEHTYTTTGTFTVKLTVTDTANCSNTSTHINYIRIGRAKPDFGMAPSSGCAPLKVFFTNLTTPSSGNTYFWDFGEGNTSTQQNPDNLFHRASDTFTVKLKVTSPAGCVDSITKTVVTLPRPDVSFTASDSLSCERNFIVKFTNTSPTGTVVSWDFGDGRKGTGNNPTNMYADTGLYTVKLTVRGANGCTNTIEKKDYIKITLPKVAIEADTHKGCAPLTVKFTNNSTSVLPIAQYKWDFGDGTTFTGKTPPAHIFTKDSSYKVKLVVTTTTGCKDSIFLDVMAGKKPTVDFTVSRKEGCIRDMKVQFTSLVNTFPVKADSFFWDFGDGGTSDIQNPEHQYDIRKGTYTVTLWAGNKGCTDSLVKKDFIKILPPWAMFSFNQKKCSEDSVSFVDESVGADSVTYYFGDGTTSNERNPVHKYEPGFYQVIMHAYNDSTGCIDTFNTTVTVNPLIASFFSSDTSGCYPLSVTFTSSVSKDAAYTWDFGDGQTSTDEHPTHFYEKKGLYDVSLRVVDSDSCVKIISKPKHVYTYGPEVDFRLENTEGCVPLKVKLIDSSSSDFPLVSKTWDMGDGSILPVTSDTMYYTYNIPPDDQPSGYPITQKLEDSAGCIQSLTNYVYPSHPRPDFTITTIPSCGSIEYIFTAETGGYNGLGPFTFKWTIDGATYTTHQPSKVFSKSGTYAIKLVVTDRNGCVDSISKTINLDIRYPTAKMSAAPAKADCPPLHAKFKDETILGFTGIQSWHWDFGDGTSSILQNPEKIYLKPGNFTVTLVITDSVGCTDTVISPDLIVIKGPTGTLEFDTAAGCVPHTVNFKVKSKNAYYYTWDLGDGTILVNTKQSALQHEYGYASSFIPSVTLTDSFGCTYQLPPTDTIVVNPLPIADFSFTGHCFGYPVFFTDLSVPMVGNTVKWFWEFGDGETSTDTNPQHTYTAGGTYDASLTVTNSSGCVTKTTKKVRIYGLDAKFKTSQPTGCVGHPMSFIDNTEADTLVTSWHWDFGDSTISSLSNPQHTYMQKGIYKVRLIATDIKGCSDTFTLEQMLIGDTLPPPAPTIYRVTVENDKTVELDFSKYRDIDFAKYIIYRKSGGGAFQVIDSVLDANDTIYFDNSVTTLHTVYCYKVQVKNICGYTSVLLNNEHCTIELTATPAINAAVLKWTPYQGWNKVEKYEIYREDVYNVGSYYVVGTVHGDTTGFSDSSIICYRTHTYKIKAYEDSGFNQVSWSDTSTTTPIYVPRVPPSAVVRATVENNKEILVEWLDLPKIKVKNFIVERSEDGVIYKMIENPFERNILSLVDKKVDINLRSYYYRVKVIDSCGDASPYSNLGKTILLRVDTTDELRPRLSWSAYREWPYGVKYYDIELKQADGTFLKIGQTTSGFETTFIDKTTNLNSLPDYCYRVIGHRESRSGQPDEFTHVTSTSNEACTPIRSILWVPNVFTPNLDSTNDKFFATGMYIKEFEMKIFDRWGARVYESTNIDEGWDGKYHSTSPLMDAYKYIIKAQGVDGRNFYRQGWVTILR